MTFSDAEIAYLDSQWLGRLTTIDAHGRPQIRAVGVHYNPETRTIDVVGWGLANSQKFRNARRNPEVAFIVDDLASTNPWRPRSVEIRGWAETLTESGASPWGDAVIRLHPRRIISEGLDASGDKRTNARDVPE